MKKLIVFGLVVGLVAGSFSIAEAAPKKKKKAPVPTSAPMNFFIRDEVDGCDDDPVISTVDGPDTATCSFVTNGIANEVLFHTGEGAAASYTMVATAGVPFVLDATKDITTDFTLRAYHRAESPIATGGGQATLDVSITGTIAGETKEIAAGSATFATSPASERANVKMTLKPDAALDKAEVTSLELTTLVRGAAVLTGWFVLDDPASFFTVNVIR